MLISLTFILNAGLNFLLGLCVAGVLGPEAYGRFSVAFTAASLAATLVFDWLRLSATRYYSERSRTEAPDVRAALDAGYLAGVLILAALAGLALLLGWDFGMSRALIAGAMCFAVSTGLFEFAAALFRARFRNQAYSGLIILKNILVFGGMVGAGYVFPDPSLVMFMAAGSVFLATMALSREARDPHSRLPQARRSQIALYLRYGGPIVVANVCYQAVTLANRGAAAARLDFAAAGQLSLATDMTIRLILVAGAALDVLLFQIAVHKKATEGDEAGQRQVSRNSAMILAALTLLCLGYVADLPAFTALIAPQKFRDSFEPLSLILAPGVTLFCVGQFCLNPIAQLENRTALVLGSGFATAALDFVLIWLAPPQASLMAYALIHSASLAAGFALMAALTFRQRAYWPGARDVMSVALAGAAALAAMWPLRQVGPPPLALVLVASVGVFVYSVALYLLDLGGFIRPAVARRLLSRARRRETAQQF